MNFRLGGGAIRPTALAVAAMVAALTLVCTQRAVAAVTVANAALISLNVPAATDSASFTYPAPPNYPTLITATDRTSNDGVIGIASIAVTWVNNVPNVAVWTGTSKNAGVVGGQTTVANTTLAPFGIGVALISDVAGGNVNRFKVRNTSGTAAAVTILEIW